MSGRDTKIPDYKPDCSPGPNNIVGVEIINPITRKLHFTKVIYNYKEKSKEQIINAVQLEIDNTLLKYPAYKFVDSKSHFNKTGEIELQLNFELK